ncbi:MAG: GNAT family N-acetyltransferase [Clostridium sp.]|uniref:GNAT family N-acetyltransferase n=1 Tax=Clostridium sp. TaxID=1506 RepID=UPI0030584008
MKVIVGNDKIFESEKFRKDIVRYNIMRLIKDSSSPEIYSDGADIIVARSNINTPLWIWTSEDITSEKIEELMQLLDKLLSIGNSTNITYKDNIYEKIEERYSKKLNRNDYLKMCSYQCLNPTLNREKNGKLGKASFGDRKLIASFLVDEYEELSNVSTTIEEQLDRAEKLIRNDDFYVWKDSNDKIVSMALIAYEDSEYARINTVFTDRSNRVNGYAGMLMYEISKMILAKNKIPVLYTDKSYIASNKAYKNVGYMECGDLNSITITNSSFKYGG